jgi:hypothetical protein
MKGVNITKFEYEKKKKANFLFSPSRCNAIRCLV